MMRLSVYGTPLLKNMKDLPLMRLALRSRSSSSLFPTEASTTRRSIPSPLAFIGRIVYGPFYT